MRSGLKYLGTLVDQLHVRSIQELLCLQGDVESRVVPHVEELREPNFVRFAALKVMANLFVPVSYTHLTLPTT